MADKSVVCLFLVLVDAGILMKTPILVSVGTKMKVVGLLIQEVSSSSIIGDHTVAVNIRGAILVPNVLQTKEHSERVEAGLLLRMFLKLGRIRWSKMVVSRTFKMGIKQWNPITDDYSNDVLGELLLLEK